MFNSCWNEATNEIENVLSGSDDFDGTSFVLDETKYHTNYCNDLVYTCEEEVVVGK